MARGIYSVVTAVVWVGGCVSEHRVHSKDAPLVGVPAYGDDSGPHPTHWYVLDDGVAYETASDDRFDVGFHGDPALYWYEPSGHRGLIESVDPEADFQGIRDYVVTRSDGPFFVDTPLSFRSDSTLNTFDEAVFTYVVCDFWVDGADVGVPYRFETGAVDDGVLVLFNGRYVDHLLLGESGGWDLSVRPGETNSLIVVLVDDSAYDRHFLDLALTRDGVLVH